MGAAMTSFQCSSRMQVQTLDKHPMLTWGREVRLLLSALLS